MILLGIEATDFTPSALNGRLSPEVEATVTQVVASFPALCQTVAWLHGHRMLP
jgi:hypothetical protein